MNADTLLPPPPYPSDTNAVGRILQLLACNNMQDERGRLRWSSNYTFLVSVCDAEYQTLAIYKPQPGERPLWDFPDGTLCYRERAAFIVSEALGWRIVPPTVLCEGARGLGSVQFYIEHNPEITFFNLDDSFTLQLQRIAVFDYLTNNADRKGGHCLLDEQGKVWGIDHGLTFHVAPKLRTVIWEWAGAPVPDDLLQDVAKLQTLCLDAESEAMQVLSTLLSAREIAALLGRVERLLTTRIFPQPGHGPSYPWPPI